MLTRTLLFTIFILSIFTTAFSQDGTRAVDYNTKSIGRGGTEIGFFDSPSLILTNPGGLSFLKSDILTANSIFMLPSPTFKNYSNNNGVTGTTVLNDANGDKVLYVLPSISYVHKFPQSKFSIGAGVFTTGGMGADFTLSHMLFKDASGNYVPQTYNSRFAIIESGISAAYEFIPNLSFGITGEFVYTTLKFSNPYTLDPSILKGQATPYMTFGQMFAAPRAVGGLGYTEVTSMANMTDLKSYSFGGKIGLAYKFNESFSMGISYTMPVTLDFKNGKSDLDMTDQFTDAEGRAVQNVMMAYPGISQAAAADTVLHQFLAMGINPSKGFAATYDIENKFKLPQSFGFGLMYSPNLKWRFGFDFEWINWSNAFDQMSLTLKNGNNDNINRMLGAGGSGQQDLNVAFLLNWKDAVLLKFGGECDLSDKFTLRLGYAYTTNPIPPSTIIPIIPAVLEHHLMGGFSYRFVKKFEVSFAAEFGFKNKVTGDNPHLIAAEYNNSESSLMNLLGHISLSYMF